MGGPCLAERLYSMPHLTRVLLALLLGHVSAGGYRADYLDEGQQTPVGVPIQSCIDASNPNITIYEGCKPVVGNNSITVQANLTEFATYVGKTFRSLIYVQSSGCRMGIVNFACGIFYPKCDRVLGTICPCQEEVGTLHSSCEGDSYGRFLANFSVSLLQNLTRDGRNCGTLLPEHNPYLPCYHPHGATGQMQCPPGTVQPDQHGARVVTVDRENGPNWPLVPRGVWGGGEIEACKLPCSSNLFEDGEARASVTLVTTLAWISAGACVLLFVLFHVGGKKELNTWPARLQVYFTGCAFFLSLALTFGSLIEYSDSMWCENAALCTIQALMLEYFGIALGMWWLVICFNLFLTVKALHDRAVSPQDPWDGGDSTEYYERFYHLFAWGVPGIFTLILSYKDKLGYPVYGNPSYCWIADEDSSEWSWFFFHAEILAIVFIGMIFFVVSVVWLRSLTKESIPTWRGLLTSIWGVVIHVVTFAATFAFMGIYQVTLTTQQDIIRQAYENYIGCVIKRWWMTAFPARSRSPVSSPRTPTWCSWTSNRRYSRR